MITHDFWVYWFGGEVSSKIGSYVRKNQDAIPIADARREEGAAYCRQSKEDPSPNCNPKLNGDAVRKRRQGNASSPLANQT